MDTIVSDLKQLNKDLKAVSSLRIELWSSQEKIFKNIDLVQKSVKFSGTDHHYISINPATQDYNDIFNVINHDLEKLKEEVSDITILKGELWSYQKKSDHQIKSLEKLTQ